ncbi:hypothetical protein HanIR_Chr03g0106161 [Helianthus annuus]|nr:hypothetical protein HanIR_Chr03g0106161 [Helianthus annuus]
MFVFRVFFSDLHFFVFYRSSFFVICRSATFFIFLFKKMNVFSSCFLDMLFFITDFFKFFFFCVKFVLI